MSWLAKIFSRRGAPHAAVVRKAATAKPAKAADPTPAVAAAPVQPFLPWVAGSMVLSESALSPHEQRILNELDSVLALPAVPDTMLPRAAELVPQMIALLRETHLPLQAIAQRVSKDELLAAEVMRLASSPFYRAQGDVVDVSQAIRLIGSMGLQTVIASVVLKPIYRGSSSPISADVAARLWEHSEALAEHMAVLADAHGLPAFDGYLAGMLHNTGWKVALCAVERAGLTLEAQPSAAFATALQEQVHRLFGLAAQRWAISPGFVAFASDARSHGLAGAQHAMTSVLQQAQRQCMAGAQQREATPVPADG